MSRSTAVGPILVGFVVALVASGCRGTDARPVSGPVSSPTVAPVGGPVAFHVQLGAGIFCRSIGWLVYVNDVGFVEFRLDGKVGKVQKI